MDPDPAIPHVIMINGTAHVRAEFYGSEVANPSLRSGLTNEVHPRLPVPVSLLYVCSCGVVYSAINIIRYHDE